VIATTFPQVRRPTVSLRLFAVLLALAFGIAGCGRWSSAERRQIQAFTTSVIKAEQANTLSPLDVQKVSTALEEALDAADDVTDPVLAKIHPQLPDRYRTRFVAALRMRREALRELQPGEPLTAKQLEWQLPMKEWGDWYSANVAAMRQSIDQ
jgi:hypothetical protein